MVAEQRGSGQTFTRQRDTSGSQPMGNKQGLAGGIVEQGKKQVAQRMNAVSEAVRHTEECLREGEGEALGPVAERIAETIGQAGRYIDQADPRTMLRDVNSLARRHPEIFLGGAVLAGVILGRFLRAHPPRDEYEGGEHAIDRMGSAGGRFTGEASPAADQIELQPLSQPHGDRMTGLRGGLEP